MSEAAMKGKVGEKDVYREWLSPSCGFFYTINEVLYRGSSDYQDIELVDTDEFGKVLLLDGILQVAEKHEYQYHEPMVHFPMISHPSPHDVLLIGGGDGGILRELVKYRSVRRIDFVDLDREVVEFARTHLESIHQGAFDDPRIFAHFQDGRSFVEKNPAAYDVVIMDMTDPFGPAKMLYTREFFQAVRDSFKSDAGVFMMHGESPIARPIAFASIRKTLSSVFPSVHTATMFVQMYATLWSMMIASVSSDPLQIAPTTVDERLKAEGITGLHVMNAHTWQAMLTVPPYITELYQKDACLITDAHPDFPDDFLE
ncbi:MAG TPA: polyamine aminopropyltransferase [Spirochaetia bacterium]|jgi:spermidine synthase|nr:polyamine aminopropyltransferase [Spirochaetia bacterium]